MSRRLLSCLVLFCFFFLPGDAVSLIAPCWAQESPPIETMEAKILQLEAEKSRLEAGLAEVASQLDELRQAVVLQKASSPKGFQTVVSSVGRSVYEEPTMSSKIVRTVTPRQPVTVLDYDNERSYYRVRVGDTLGYVMAVDLVETPELSALRKSRGFIGKSNSSSVASVPGPSPRAVSSPAPKSQPTYSGRCQATTKKGTQCSRTAKPGSKYCWQHGG